MLYRNQIKKNFSAVAGEYEARADFQAEVAGELLSFMSRTGPLWERRRDGEGAENHPRVLDTGCGTGLLMSGLFSEREGGLNKGPYLFGLDFALPMLIEAERCARRGLVNGACEALPFGPGAFDHVVSNLAYQWVTKLSRAFSEVERVLAAGGSFSFSTLGPTTLNELLSSLEAADKARQRFRFTPFASLEDIEDALRIAGLKLVNVKKTTLLRSYKNTLHLLKTLKNTGASARGEVTEGSLSSGTFLKEVLSLYEKNFSRPDGTVRATYEVILVTAKKRD